MKHVLQILIYNKDRIVCNEKMIFYQSRKTSMNHWEKHYTMFMIDKVQFKSVLYIIILKPNTI